VGRNELGQAMIETRRPPCRIVAVDWSGDKTASGQRKKIWVADWQDGELDLSGGRTREETTEYLIAAARATPDMVVGLDFAFSYPAWFVREQGCESAAEFWELVARGKGEEWLSTSNSFCWGRKGRRCPDGHREPEWLGFRQTDRAITIGGIQPKSPFQIGGAGAVGTGSLRGMPMLDRLRRAGFGVWPFTTPGFPVAVEIYPRLFTGKGNKSGQESRARHLGGAPFSGISLDAKGKAENSEDAFDALCSVFAMTKNAADFANLKQTSDPDARLEGRIWRPTSDP
jgi:hypothetical protein